MAENDNTNLDQIKDSTTNVLKDFDVVASLTLKHITTQLADAWRKWHSKTGGLNVCKKELIKKSPDGKAEQDVRFALDIRLGAPAISTNAQVRSMHDVIATFTIASGTLSKTVGGTSASLNLTGRKIWIKASTVKNTVSEEQLYHIDTLTSEQVVALKKTSNAGALTIECLFLNLTSIDLINGFGLLPLAAGQTAKLTFTGTPASANNQEAILQELETQLAPLLQSHFANDKTPEGDPAGRFLLNTTVRPHVPAAEPSLQINDLRFKVTQAPADDLRAYPHSLDYLGTVTGGTKMPAEGESLNKALGALGSWLTPERVAGTKGNYAGLMALRGARITTLLATVFQKSLTTQYDTLLALNEAKKQALGGVVDHPETQYPYPEVQLLRTHTPSADEASGIVSIASSDAHNTYTWTGREDGNRIDFTLKKSLTLRLIPVPYGHYALKGEIIVALTRLRHTVWGSVDTKLKSIATIDGEVLLEALKRPDNPTCLIRPKLKIAISTPQPSSETKTHGLLTDVFNEPAWDRSQAKGFSENINATVKVMLEKVFAALTLELKNFAIVPPGGEAFGFAKPRIGPKGDLFLDLTYESVLTPT